MPLPLPDYTNPATLAQSFNNFFTDKIDKIMAIIEVRNKNTFTVPSHVLELDEQSTDPCTDHYRNSKLFIKISIS